MVIRNVENNFTKDTDMEKTELKTNLEQSEENNEQDSRKEKLRLEAKALLAKVIGWSNKTPEYYNDINQKKDMLINKIIKIMDDIGEFSYYKEDTQKEKAINTVKKQLKERNIEELEVIFNSYNQNEKVESSVIHK